MRGKGRELSWHIDCSVPPIGSNSEQAEEAPSEPREGTMDFAMILLVTNSVMAVFIYCVVFWMWHE